MRQIAGKMAVLAIVAMAAGGCGTKECRCYVMEPCRAVRVSKTHIDKETPCRELGYATAHPRDNSYRYCTDWDTAELTDKDIGIMFPEE